MFSKLNQAHFEEKMRKPAFKWILNVLLTILIFYNAELGRLLGLTVQPLAISVIWPATGFSLAALLLFGFQAWPGIFFGNLFYNLYHLLLSNPSIDAIIPALLISFGSLLQAFVGAYIIRRFSTTDYFDTFKDILIFLFFGGFFICMIASTIGITTLYLYSQNMTWQTSQHLWLTFWLGDIMGVYIFTPLLVMWSIRRPLPEMKKHVKEIIFMVALFAIAVFLTFFMNYPLWYIFLPLSLWIAYRFFMLGATVAIFIISFISIALTAYGRGPFVENVVYIDPYISLIIFLLTLVITTLLFTALVKERRIAWIAMERLNIELRQAVEMYSDEIKEIHGEISDKTHFAWALDRLTFGIADKMLVSLEMMKKLAKASLESLYTIKEKVQERALPVEEKLTHTLLHLNDNLQNLQNYEVQIERLTRILKEESMLTSKGQRIRWVNVNNLMEVSLQQLANEIAKEHPNFTYTVKKHFDTSLKLMRGLPEALAHAFILILKNSVLSMIKKKQLSPNYNPILEVSTFDRKENIEVVFKDNGLGFPENQLKKYAKSFVVEEPIKIPEELAAQIEVMEMSLANDLIMHIHKGNIRMDSKAEEYCEVHILLPKSPKHPL